MKQVFVNMLGAFGYLFLTIQWIWMIVIIGLPLTAQPAFQELFMPNTQPAQQREIASRDPMPEPLQMVILVISIGLSVGIIIYALVKVPSTIGLAGQRITQKAATKAVPVITHHKKLSKKKERKLVERITWTIKIIAILIPVLALIVPPGEMIDLGHNVSIAFGLLLAGLTAANFALQFVFVRLWKIEARRVW